jgi:hypothetical protein
VDVGDDDRESARCLGHLGLHRQVTAAFSCHPEVDADGPDSRWPRVFENHLRRIPGLFGQRHEGGAAGVTSLRRPTVVTDPEAEVAVLAGIDTVALEALVVTGHEPVHHTADRAGRSRRGMGEALTQ